MRKAIAAFFILLVVGGCRDNPENAYVELTGKIFIFNYRVATATYVVTLGKLRQIPEGSTVETRFDNPAGGGIIVVLQKVWPKMEKITVESPPVFCIVKERPYSFTISLKGPEGLILQKLDGKLMSNLDQSVLPDRPLVVGPVYTRNPELAGRPDGKLTVQGTIKCPL